MNTKRVFCIEGSKSWYKMICRTSRCQDVVSTVVRNLLQSHACYSNQILSTKSYYGSNVVEHIPFLHVDRVNILSGLYKLSNARRLVLPSSFFNRFKLFSEFIAILIPFCAIIQLPRVFFLPY